MKPKAKMQPTTDNCDKESAKTRDFFKDGLLCYTLDPGRFPASRVVYYDADFVCIHDMFPKATVHLLILPRDPTKNMLRPQEAFDDEEFLRQCRAEERKVRLLVAEELRRRFGQYSKTEQARNEAMEAEDIPEVLPPGRDWLQDVQSGIHANPSMNHLHIHVLSKDMVSESMKKSNHYLSFNTDFFVGLEDFPLAMDDHRRKYASFRDKGMVCWRCGKDFGHEVKKLKAHLQDELNAWKRE
ncbi:hypothetical protein CERZMDRAFT_67320 [Cercospora zeae-maydis SCOH1-5]|uniref:Aprataxin-like protein n=1 Tax=Cercospora zeae-maydis SCOH1-5 TaxID=717836 RepID=A0A6A6FI28_9PEZI|nr:hypothetical protein CERZMDRAFT_67320 [Cercospora zeae-maydis SCOH1-5]